MNQPRQRQPSLNQLTLGNALYIAFALTVFVVLHESQTILFFIEMEVLIDAFVLFKVLLLRKRYGRSVFGHKSPSCGGRMRT